MKIDVRPHSVAQSPDLVTQRALEGVLFLAALTSGDTDGLVVNSWNKNIA